MNLPRGLQYENNLTNEERNGEWRFAGNLMAGTALLLNEHAHKNGGVLTFCLILNRKLVAFAVKHPIQFKK